MANLTTVGLTGGLGTSGTGTISTLDNMFGTAGSANTNVLTVQGIASGTAQPVSGTVTANAGTNLNTSTLALESGGNLATLAGTVSSSRVNVAQATAANLNATVIGAGSAGTANTGVVTVQGIASMTPLLVNPGTASNFGVVTQGSTTSGQSGSLMQGAVTTSSPSYTTAQTSPLSLDTSGNLRVNVVAGGGSGGTSSSFAAAFPSTGTAIGAKNGANMVNLAADSSNNLLTSLASGSTVVAVKAASTAPAATDPSLVVALSPNSVNANGQATMANSAPVVIASNQSNISTINGASTYQAVAASQTATVLQTSTGATGDYLSHVVIYPTSTSPGAVTVFDSTNTAANSAVLFAGGSTSVSNLAPISIPVGAKSVNGAWKVTTGANVSIVAVGKFS